MLTDRRQRKKNSTLQSLIVSATRLFAERGIYQTTIDEITTAADLGKGTFYKHFASREELLAVVIRQGFDLLLADLENDLPGSLPIFQAMLERHAHFFTAHPEYLLIFHQTRGWLTLIKPDHSPIKEEFRRYIRALADILKKSSSQADDRVDDSDEVLFSKARFLAGAISGVLSFEYTLGSGLGCDSSPKNIGAGFNHHFFSAENQVASPDDIPPVLLAAAPLPEPATRPNVRPIRNVAINEWAAACFLEEAVEWLPLLGRSGDLETIRQSILERVNQKHFQTYADLDGRHELDCVIVRDCARVWRGLLHPRSEQLAGFSVLQALVDTARGMPPGELTPSFWAEICHLVRALEGRVHLHDQKFLTLDETLSGREAAIARSTELDLLSGVMAGWMNRYANGLGEEAIFRRAERRDGVLAQLGGSETDWHDWRWHLRHIARNAKDLARLAPLTAEEIERIDRAMEKGIPFGVTPFYASLFDKKGEAGRDLAIRAQVIPPLSYSETFADPEEGEGAADFMREADTSPIELITRRYAAIAIFKPYNSCPQICVYCQRNWEINEPLEAHSLAPKKRIDAAIDWLAEHPGIHEVLLTGGDPLVLSNSRLESILDGLAALPHIERIRIGTRTLATLPMRITPALCKLLQSYVIPGRREICLVTHIEHAYEVTPDLARAANRLRRHGISVYNQMVYTFFVSRRFEAALLRRLLRRCGIDPYYTFYPKAKAEMMEYRLPIARMLQERGEEARLLPGMARTDEAIYNVPGLGKNYLNSWQHRDLISIRPNGARVYEFHPWEKKIMPQRTYVGDDVPILEYLQRLAATGEDPAEYDTIWYYY